jgi:lysophospholipase
LPNIGIAVSGGGYRALMNGGGALQAFDNRTTNSTVKGQLGGILQSATYLSGLSGGSWLVGSMYMNNFSDVSSLRDNGSVWQFQDSIFSGPTQSTTWSISTAKYYSQLLGAVDGKSDAGYEVSITDYWYVPVTLRFEEKKKRSLIESGDVLSLTNSSTRLKVALAIPGHRLL